MIVAPRERENIARGPLENIHRRPSLLGRSLQQLFLEFLLEISIPGPFSWQLLDSLHQEFRRPARQIEHLFGRHPEIIASRARRFSS